MNLMQTLKELINLNNISAIFSLLKAILKEISAI